MASGRLLVAADKNMDANLARSVWSWMQQAQQKFGPESGSAATIGDMLLKLGQIILQCRDQAFHKNTFLKLDLYR